MPNFLEALQQKRAQLAQPTSTLGQTERAQQLLRARSGRSVGGGLATSNVQEQVENREASRVQMEQIAPQIEQQQVAQQAQSQDISRGEQQALAEVKQARHFDTLNNKIQLNGLLADLQRDRGQLALEQKQSSLEQAGFLLSMQDKKYVDDLLRIGQTRRLNNKMNFLTELQDVIFGDSVSVLKEKLQQGNILALSRRDYQEAISSLSVNEAIRIAELEMASRERTAAMERDYLRYGAEQRATSAAIQSKYEGFSGITSGVLRGIDTYSANQERKETKNFYDELAKIRNDQSSRSSK